MNRLLTAKTTTEVEAITKPKPRRPKWGDPGSRATRRTNASVYSNGRRRVIVTIYPSGVIGLRLERTRSEEYINADDAYRAAVITRRATKRASKRS